MRIFLDTNVVLDVLAERKLCFADSAAVLSFLESDDVEGFVAAHTMTTLYFLIEKALDGRKARTALLDLLKLVRVAPVDQSLLLKALSLAWDDFEDAVQGACAVEIGADYFITRNAADFAGLSIPVQSPAEFLSMLKGLEAEPAETEAPAAAPRRTRRSADPDPVDGIGEGALLPGSNARSPGKPNRLVSRRGWLEQGRAPDACNPRRNPPASNSDISRSARLPRRP